MNRLNLFIDDRFHSGISAQTLAKHSLYKGKVVSEKELNSIVYEELSLRFLDRTTNYIARGLKPERRVIQYLKELHFKKKGLWFSEELQIDFEKIFDEILMKLKKYNYIDDLRYATQFISDRMRSRPRSKSILQSELIAKGIGHETAKQAILESDGSDEDLLFKLYNKKYKEQPLDLKDNKKVNFMRRKGFHWDEIVKLEKKLKDDIRE